MAFLRNTALMLAGGAAVAAIVLAERRQPLRDQKQPTGPRTVRNLAFGAGCAAVVAAVEVPLTERIAHRNEAERRGIAQAFPRPLRFLAGLMAMDYGFYLWHVATHKVPLLWRLHRIHHVDPDMDVSTAVRFHPVDMLVSLPWRLVQVRLSGVGPRALAGWRHFFNASIIFHHSNWRLPGRWDERLSRVITTPAMHGIHHSQKRAERDSNWSSGFSLWDRLHGTFRSRPDGSQPLIGVADEETEG